MRPPVLADERLHRCDRTTVEVEARFGEVVAQPDRCAPAPRDRRLMDGPTGNLHRHLQRLGERGHPVDPGVDAALPDDHQVGRLERFAEQVGDCAELFGACPAAGVPAHDDPLVGQQRRGSGRVDQARRLEGALLGAVFGLGEDLEHQGTVSVAHQLVDCGADGLPDEHRIITDDESQSHRA